MLALDNDLVTQPEYQLRCICDDCKRDVALGEFFLKGCQLSLIYFVVSGEHSVFHLAERPGFDSVLF